jgi:hypothetical protein
MEQIRRPLVSRIITISILSALVIACGYSFTSTGEYIDKRISKIYVEQFGNKTDQAEVENYIRSAFINQIIQTSRFKIAEDIQLADATIKGNIVNLNTSPLSYRSNTIVAEERAVIILEVTFRERENNKIIWSAKNLTGFVDYNIESNIDLLPATRKAAFIKLAADTAEKIFNQMMSGF